MVRRCSLFEVPSVARDPYSLGNLKEQIFPLRVTLREQCDLLFSSPLFDLLLAICRYCGIAEGLKIHQSVDLVFRREAIEHTGLVLLYSLPEIVSETNVQSPAET